MERVFLAANDNNVEVDLLSQDLSWPAPTQHYAWNQQYGICTFKRTGQKLYVNDTHVFAHAYRPTGEIDSPLNARCMYINIVEACARVPITDAILKVLGDQPHLIPREWWGRPIVALGTGMLMNGRTYVHILKYSGKGEPVFTLVDVDLVVWQDCAIAPVLQTIDEVRSALLV